MIQNKVSIIIPTLNAGKTLDACLESIKKLDYPRELIETIIVDSDSSDDTASIAKKHGAMLLHAPTRGPTFARLCALSEATGNIVAFTDGDAVVDAAWLKNGVQHIRENPMSVVGGPLQANNQNSFAIAMQAIFDLPEVLKLCPPHEIVTMTTEVPMLPTANFIVNTSALLKLSRSSYNGYAGDHLLSSQLREKGYRLFVHPDVKVSHCKRSTPAAAFKEIFKWGKGRARTLPRTPSSPIRYVMDYFLPLCAFATMAMIVFPASSFPIIVLGATPLILESIWAGIFKRSLLVALCSPVAVTCFAFGWSIGYVYGLSCPTQNTSNAQRD